MWLIDNLCLVIVGNLPIRTIYSANGEHELERASREGLQSAHLSYPNSYYKILAITDSWKRKERMKYMLCHGLARLFYIFLISQ